MGKVIKVAGTYGYDNGKEHLDGITLQAANRYGHRSTLEWAMNTTRRVVDHNSSVAMSNWWNVKNTAKEWLIQ